MAEKTTKTRVLVGSRVIIEPVSIPYQHKTEEDVAVWLREWAKKIDDFFKDHRHMDVNHAFVDLEYEIRCDACGKEWELCDFEKEGDEEAYRGCAWCGAEEESIT